MSLINPIITFIGIAAIYFQAREILAQPAGSGPVALSLRVLLTQIVTFALLSIGMDLAYCFSMG